MGMMAVKCGMIEAIDTNDTIAYSPAEGAHIYVEA